MHSISFDKIDKTSCAHLQRLAAGQCLEALSIFEASWLKRLILHNMVVQQLQELTILLARTMHMLCMWAIHATRHRKLLLGVASVLPWTDFGDIGLYVHT